MLIRIWSFVLLTRPHFLLGGTLVYALGAALAASMGIAIDWGRYALGQIMLTSIQLTTHYANEYFDLDGDRLIGPSRTWFSGGSGVLPAGRLAPRVAWRAAHACGAVAVAAIFTALFVAPALSAIGALALAGGWFYSAPPLRIEASGFGEVMTALIVAFLSPLSAIAAQRGPFDARLIALALPLMLVNLAMLLTVEFPDYDADSQAGKRNLVVRFGRAWAARLHNALLVSAFGSVWLAAAAGWIESRLALWTLIGLPLATWQIAGVADRRRRGWRALGWLAAGGVALFALTAASLLAGVLTA
jgi:1,4-dihydroxy-2-naphthoate octaprenyltransferase